MVFCGLFPTEADRFPDLREALGKLQLNDAALVYEPEARVTAGGCGFWPCIVLDHVRLQLNDVALVHKPQVASCSSTTLRWSTSSRCGSALEVAAFGPVLSWIMSGCSSTTSR